jgi:hypothetical protein
MSDGSRFGDRSMSMVPAAFLPGPSGNTLRRLWIPVLVLAGFSALDLPVLPAAGDGTLQGFQRIPMKPVPVGLTAGDFDGDGRPGIATVHGTNQLNILDPDPLNFGRWSIRPLDPVGQASFHIRAADFNGDGADDLVVADPSTCAYFLRCRGDGSFERADVLDRIPGPRSIAVGDYDRDGLPDVALVYEPEDTVSIYLGNPDGKFRNGKCHPSGFFHANHDVDATDYDGDGFLDLAIAVYPGGVMPMKGLGNGEFNRKALVSNLESEVVLVGAGDFDGDGLGDLIVQGCLWDGTYSTSVGLSARNGTFKRVQRFPDFYCTPARADMNGDGFLDLVVPVKDKLEVHLGKGDGQFLPPMSFFAGFAPFAATCAARGQSSQVLARDLDLDGRLDVIAANPRWPSVVLARGREDERLLETAALLPGVSSANGIVIGDWDRDSFPDIFVSSFQKGAFAFLNPGKTFPDAPSFSVLPSENLRSLDVADLDGDGVLDFMGTTLKGTGLLEVLFLDRDGKISVEKQLAFPSVLGPAVAVFADRNGTADLAAPSLSSSQIAIFPNLGGRDFGPPWVIPTISKPRRLVLADLDGDGPPDLVVISDPAIVVQFGDGAGGFTAPLTIGSGAEKTFTGLAVSDMDRDGSLDIVTCGITDSGVRIFRGKGGREFGEASVLRLDLKPLSLALGDLDGDSRPDLVVSNLDDPSFSVILGKDLDGWTAPVTYQLGGNPTGLRLADLDLDGALDVVALGNSGAWVLFGNRAAPNGEFRRGDVDGSGRMDLTDPLAILSRLFRGGELLECEDAADSNDDGVVDLTDAIVLLLRLFLGGDPLPPPGSEACDPDPTPDSLAHCSRDC